MPQKHNIKWVGYSSTENTWELPSNIIPQEMLDSFEQKQLDYSRFTQSQGDQVSRKLINKKDFIVNK